MVGFNVKDINYIKPIYICPCCSFLLRDTVQVFDCGHRSCQSCIDDQIGDMITCYECNQKVSRKNVKPDRGFRNDMQILSITCNFCEWTDVLKNYQNHLNQNHQNPICNYCNEKFTSVNDLNHHQRFNCKKITISCPLHLFGCSEMILRDEVVKHYSNEKHQIALVNFVRQIQKRISGRIVPLTYAQINDINESIKTLANNIEALGGDIRRLSMESVQCQNMLQSALQKLPILTKFHDEHNTFVDSMKPFQENLEKDVISTRQKLNALKSVSYDGTYIWKITEVREKIAAAQSGTQTLIDSLPFHSSPTGYKCCLRLNWTGDGSAHGTHMSLFFVLMRGEYDAILTFPFCFKVIFCLYDQTNQQNHIIDVFRPNPIADSFKKPNTETNVPCGIPKFVDLKVFQQEDNPYVRDDTMFIKVIIDFDNLTKDILPYALHLNPALTTDSQHAMIQEETEKRKQQQQQI